MQFPTTESVSPVAYKSYSKRPASIAFRYNAILLDAPSWSGIHIYPSCGVWIGYYDEYHSCVQVCE